LCDLGARVQKGYNQHCAAATKNKTTRLTVKQWVDSRGALYLRPVHHDNTEDRGAAGAGCDGEASTGDQPAVLGPGVIEHDGHILVGDAATQVALDAGLNLAARPACCDTADDNTSSSSGSETGSNDESGSDAALDNSSAGSAAKPSNRKRGTKKKSKKSRGPSMLFCTAVINIAWDAVTPEQREATEHLFKSQDVQPDYKNEEDLINL
jgi:hypothetical protein